MYKDKDKQREANKAAMKRYRAKKQGITPDVKIDKHQDALGRTNAVIPDTSDTLNVIPEPPKTDGMRPFKRFTGLLTKQRQLSRKGFNDG